MKKNVLALSVATMIGGLGFSGSALAQAQFLVNDGAQGGTGHIQIVPYFTAQGGNATALHIVNTDAVNAKAVKVRFRGASNSDDIMDFQLFLSPGDVWAGMVKAGANGLLHLTTSDNSCTLPKEVRLNEQDGGTYAKTERLEENPVWAADVDKLHAQTREGYVEILNMADIPPLRNGNGVAQNPLFNTVKHNASGVAPCDDGVLAMLDAVTDGSLNVGGVDRLLAPTPSLVASWYVINVANSTTFSAAATSLVATDGAGVVGTGIANERSVYSPQRQDTATLATADPLMAPAGGVYPMVEPLQYDVPDLSTPLVLANNPVGNHQGAGGNMAEAAAQAAGLTTALTRQRVSNQFYADPSLNAATDWVFSMPTRRYALAANYKAPRGVATGFIQQNAGVAGGLLFNVNPNVLSVNGEGQICIRTRGTVLNDREEVQKGDAPVLSPSSDRLSLCGEVNVATFGEYSPLGADITQAFMATPFTEGWGTVNFGGNLPVIGEAFMAAKNPAAAPGMVGNYGVTWPHFGL